MNGWNGEGFVIYNQYFLEGYSVCSSSIEELWRYWWRKNISTVHSILINKLDKWYTIEEITVYKSQYTLKFNKGEIKTYISGDIIAWARPADKERKQSNYPDWGEIVLNTLGGTEEERQIIDLGKESVEEILDTPLIFEPMNRTGDNALQLDILKQKIATLERKISLLSRLFKFQVEQDSHLSG